MLREKRKQDDNTVSDHDSVAHNAGPAVDGHWARGNASIASPRDRELRLDRRQLGLQRGLRAGARTNAFFTRGRRGSWQPPNAPFRTVAAALERSAAGSGTGD